MDIPTYSGKVVILEFAVSSQLYNEHEHRGMVMGMGISTSVHVSTVVNMVKIVVIFPLLYGNIPGHKEIPKRSKIESEDIYLGTYRERYNYLSISYMILVMPAF